MQSTLSPELRSFHNCVLFIHCIGEDNYVNLDANCCLIKLMTNRCNYITHNDSGLKFYLSMQF